MNSGYVLRRVVNIVQACILGCSSMEPFRHRPQPLVHRHWRAPECTGTTFDGGIREFVQLLHSVKDDEKERGVTTRLFKPIPPLMFSENAKITNVTGTFERDCASSKEDVMKMVVASSGFEWVVEKSNAGLDRLTSSKKGDYVDLDFGERFEHTLIYIRLFHYLFTFRRQYLNIQQVDICSHNLCEKLQRNGCRPCHWTRRVPAVRGAGAHRRKGRIWKLRAALYDRAAKAHESVHSEALCGTRKHRNAETAK
jgi:hypothetical protein